MQLKHILAVSAAALAIGLAAPAAAQDSSTNEAGPGSADNNTSVNVTDALDLNSNNSGENGNNRDNNYEDAGNNRDNDDNGNNRDNENYGAGSASRGGEIDNEDNGNNRDNENYGAGSASRGGEIDNEDNGNNRDNENYGDGSASRGGTVEDSNNDDSNDGSNVAETGGELNQGSNVASRGGELNQGNSDDDGSYNDQSGQTSAEITATQVLVAVTTDNPVSWNEDERGSVGGYRSGDMSVNGNSFSAFAGINNQAWNSGIASNAQAATNIAAQGTVSFGDAGADEDY